MEITRTIETTAPVDAVYAYLSDFTTTNEWDPGTVETRRISGSGGVGTEYHNTSKFLGRKTELVYTTKQLEPGRRIVLEGDNKTVRATDTMTLTGTAGGTRVVYNARFDFKGVVGRLAPLLSPALKPAFKKLGDEAQVEMKRALDDL
jgi:carbon monoxide dehydrogenase subunit G